MQKKRWVAKPKPEAAPVNQLAEQLQVQPEVAYLLALRGIQTFDEAKGFFRPSLKDLHNPFLMKDMDAAVTRIRQAMLQQERILIYGDYDVDGTTAVSLVYSYLKPNYEWIDTYIPDRYKEGYGVSTAGIDYAHDNDITLIIALDCGIKAIDKVAYAKEKGIDFIICDHHNPGQALPEAVAVLDPKRADCYYPYKELSGCGVGFKLVQALHQQTGGNFEDLTPLLDLLAISIGADIVPITGENRTLAYFGLQQLNSNPRPGIRALMALTQQDKFNITNVVFILGPRINAAGRIEHGKKAVELLCGQNTDELVELASLIEEHNSTRKDLDRGITQQALQMIEENGWFSRFSTVLYYPEWHKGVIGIVASRLIENYHRPTIVFTKSGEKLAGSARSVPGFDLYAALEECTDILEQFGGHMYAAGMTLKEERFSHFAERFEEVVRQRIHPDMLIPQVSYDLEIKLADINPKFFRIIKQFEPHGPGNLSPMFVSHGLKDTGFAKAVGAEEAHLKLFAFEPETGAKFSGIAFGFGHLAEEMKAGKTFSIAYHIEENVWNGQTSLQLMIKDLKVAED